MQDSSGVAALQSDAMLESSQLQQRDQQLQLTEGNEGRPLLVLTAMTKFFLSVCLHLSLVFPKIHLLFFLLLHPVYPHHSHSERHLCEHMCVQN